MRASWARQIVNQSRNAVGLHVSSRVLPRCEREEKERLTDTVPEKCKYCSVDMNVPPRVGREDVA